jgi:hypothetical protein
MASPGAYSRVHRVNDVGRFASSRGRILAPVRVVNQDDSRPGFTCMGLDAVAAELGHRASCVLVISM